MLEGCTPFPAEFAERYVRAGIWRNETIPQAIAKTALERADSIAVEDSTRSLSYSQLIAEAGAVAALLSRNGIARNDRVIVQLPNCVDFATPTRRRSRSHRRIAGSITLRSRATCEFGSRS
jgi:2,3-dihydroxybenzoate-AMP ligase